MENLKEFKNTLDQITFDSKFLEKTINNYKLSFINIRRNDVEWEIRFPIFVFAFYEYTTKNQQIPSQEEFFSFYKEKNKEFFKKENLTKEQMDGLRARVYRTYPSLVRDIHFGLVLREKNIFDNIIYNEFLDVEYGIDLVLEKNNQQVGLNLYVGTKNGSHSRNEKKKRTKKILPMESIDIPIDMRAKKVCGDFFLYPDISINKVIKEVDGLMKKGGLNDERKKTN